jgi:universal stress protein A
MKIALKEKNGRTTAKTIRRHASQVKKAATPAAQSSPHFHIQKILVPVDFSACSVRALDYALAFARPAQAEIILLHVVEPIVYPMYGQEITADYTTLQTSLLNTGRQHLAEFSRAKATEPTPMKLLVSQGGAWSEIVDTAKKEGIDLIIVSTHGHTGLRHVLLGSTAERVVRHAPCPVLIVREREREFVPVNQI